MGGIFGAFSAVEAKKKTLLEDIYLGLCALQHRGQESAGIAWWRNGDRNGIGAAKGMGLLHEAINQDELLSVESGGAIGHVRYSKAGATEIHNAHPLVANYARGSIAVAHDGAISNVEPLMSMLEARGAIFQSECDTEVMLHLMAHQAHKPPLDALLAALRRLAGGFAMVFLLEGRLIAARDPMGFRPLVIGEDDGVTYIASESCALDMVGAKLVRDVEPGEVVVIDSDGLKSFHIGEKKCESRLCSFEYVYLARPDSVIEGRSVGLVRKELGRYLARRAAGTTVDMVAGMPDSGTPSALGYAQESDVPFELAIVRNRYVGRTFIRPTQRVRDIGVRIKLNPNESILRDRSVAIVDDSIVRGTTANRIISAIRECGAKEIHMRVASPPVRFPCYYGIDLPTSENLAAARSNVEDLCRAIGADSLVYMELEDLLGAIGGCGHVCTACFSGEYPDEEGHHELEL